MSAAPTPRIILGHGFEEALDFKDRDVMPPGFVLVALSDFGTPTVLEEDCRFQEAFAKPENRRYFEDPRTHKDWLSALLGRPIRIYEPGRKYPKLHASLVNQFFFDPTEVTYGLSGVFDFPLPLNVLGEGTEPCERFYDKIEITPAYHEIKNAADISKFLTNAFELSPLPTKDTAQAIFTANPKTRLSYYHDPLALDKQLTMPISEIMRIRGPGVYYHVICRAVKETPTLLTFEDLVNKAILEIETAFQHEEVENTATGTYSAPRATKYEYFKTRDGKQRWQGHIDDFIKYLKDDLADLRAIHYDSPKLMEYIRKAETLARKGRLIRVESTLQQILANKAGGTRRRLNKKRKTNTKRNHGRAH